MDICTKNIPQPRMCLLQKCNLWQNWPIHEPALWQLKIVHNFFSSLNLYFNSAFSTWFYPKVKYFMLHSVLFIFQSYFLAMHTHMYMHLNIVHFMWLLDSKSGVSKHILLRGQIANISGLKPFDLSPNYSTLCLQHEGSHR